MRHKNNRAINYVEFIVFLKINCIGGELRFESLTGKEYTGRNGGQRWTWVAMDA
ncbi:hypothetical protein WKI13_13685 [Teredinibacter turnerae]|uniref:hypothetical protein n=1 Tax=Teredinibacter turnerae TaxID=2426 RepID=UPI000371E1B8|nr:hypothetical protein [Teredinibacter turnerae]